MVHLILLVHNISGMHTAHITTKIINNFVELIALHKKNVIEVSIAKSKYFLIFNSET